MKNIIKEIFDKIQKDTELAKIFESMKDLPNLAKGYLFQVEFIDSASGIKYDDLMLRARKVDFHEDDDGFDVTFDEFEDFRVWKQLVDFVKNYTYLNVNIKFYDSKLQTELYRFSKKCVCKKVFPLNLDVSGNKKLEIKARF
jgi:hypothetical protein